MPIHWFFESMKWRGLLEPAILISKLKAFRAILSGVLFAVFTPNHLGQYGGRIWFLPPRHATSGIFATLVGSFAQNIVYAIGGILSLALLMPRYISFQGKYFFLGFSVILSILLLIVYFQIPHWINRFDHILWVEKLKSKFKHFHWVYPLPLKTLNRTLFYSALRYLLFGLQYYILLRLFGVDQDWYWLVACIAFTFFIQTILPFPPLIAWVSRGEIALLIWSPFQINELFLLAATYSLWIINILIPSFLGLLLFLKRNYIKDV